MNARVHAAAISYDYRLTHAVPSLTVRA